MFQEQGYAATTVEQIAAAAGISPSTFFQPAAGGVHRPAEWAAARTGRSASDFGRLDQAFALLEGGLPAERAEIFLTHSRK